MPGDTAATGSTQRRSGDGAWHIWIDRGGTFTDCVAIDPAGALHTTKLLSDNPGHYADAAIEAIRRLLGLPPGDTLDLREAPLAEVRMGTTVATNALLTRTGAPTALLTTAGFADLPAIGEQDRPELFALDIQKPELLHCATLETQARVAADGTELAGLAVDGDTLTDGMARLREQGVRALAVSLLHADRCPATERELAERARAAGFEQVTAGSDASPLPRLLARTETAIVDAYLTPVLRDYIGRFRRGLGLTGAAGEPRIRFMQSAGGLVEAGHFSGKDAIVSGPAGGVVGMSRVAQLAGFDRVIGWDMGGTSTDVSHYDVSAEALQLEAGGGFERIDEATVAGVRVRAPMLNIVTVAAGGGSVLGWEFGRLTAGPESAGAVPGPACYRRGGPLAVTDANLLLGRLQPDAFPPVFGENGAEPLDPGVVRERFADLAARINRETGQDWTPERLAEGYVRIANENMAKPIKELSVARGRDIRTYALVSFGGAGGQHACAIARSLGIRDVVVHPLASLLSAWGIGHATVQRIGESAVGGTLGEPSLARARELADALAADGRSQLAVEGVPADAVDVRIVARLRYPRTDAPLGVACGTCIPDAAELRERLDRLHRTRFGFVPDTADVAIDSVEVETTSRPPAIAATAATGPFGDTGTRTVPVFFDGKWRDTRVVPREAMRVGDTITGPALIVEPHSTIVVDPGWRATPDSHGLLQLCDTGTTRTAIDTDHAIADPMLLEVFHNRFMSIAGQMGAALKKTARSTNIKERLDYSCAVFDADGGLVANAPHIPVHLGAMGEAVAHVARARRGRLRPGDAVATNSPSEGGSHLPDITVVTPVFVDTDAAPTFFVASRGHHADVGGITPGSMPPFSRTLAEEGVVFADFTLASDGRLHEAETRALLTGGPHPARTPDDNIADLTAQLAANEAGARQLRALSDEFGLPLVRAYMGHVQANAAGAVRHVIANMPADSLEFADMLDDGSPIAVTLTRSEDRRSLTIDFTGTAAQLPGNLNAPRAVTVAAVLYTLRLMVTRPIPLNSGCLLPVTLRIPPGSLLDPGPDAAVSGGNVETSQRIVDVLLGALQAAAASQGTMNNVTFGNARYQHYETIAGGAGATPRANGANAVHTHMTNTRITDPETLERRFPVRLHRFAIRRGSGGAGRHPGGDGVIREFGFLEPMDVSLVTERRDRAPYGLDGGAPGTPGRAIHIRADGTHEGVPGKARLRVEPGDRLVIETPGGGGCGAAD